MYRISSTAADRFSVVDENEQVCFVGTLRECEEWLDAQENLAAGPSRFTLLWRRIRGWLWPSNDDCPTPAPDPGSREAKPPRLAS